MKTLSSTKLIQHLLAVAISELRIRLENFPHTDKITDVTAIGEATGWPMEEGFTIRRKIGMKSTSTKLATMTHATITPLK
jgi:hypothetical protein